MMDGVFRVQRMIACPVLDEAASDAYFKADKLAVTNHWDDGNRWITVDTWPSKVIMSDDFLAAVDSRVVRRVGRHILFRTRDEWALYRVVGCHRFFDFYFTDLMRSGRHDRDLVQVIRPKNEVSNERILADH